MNPERPGIPKRLRRRRIIQYLNHRLMLIWGGEKFDSLIDNAWGGRGKIDAWGRGQVMFRESTKEKECMWNSVQRFATVTLTWLRVFLVGVVDEANFK